MAETLWVCHVIVDVFSQHGCFIIKSLSKLVKALVVSVFGAEFERREGPSNFYSAHPATKRTFIVNEAKATEIRFRNINAMSLVN